MARKKKRDYVSGAERGLEPTEHLNKGTGRVFVEPPAAYPGRRYIKDKAAPRGRYAYRAQVEEWKQSGDIANPKTEVVNHDLLEHDPRSLRGFTRRVDKAVSIVPRSRHYKTMHGRPFARSRGR